MPSLSVGLFQLTAARRRLGRALHLGQCNILFQLTAARRRLASIKRGCCVSKKFQLTAARRRLVESYLNQYAIEMFQLTAARRRLACALWGGGICFTVSTHSRPKAAGWQAMSAMQDLWGFNSQPPEGGWWFHKPCCPASLSGFNSQPPEGGWLPVRTTRRNPWEVSTHSRPKAAGPTRCKPFKQHAGFNSQPPEGGW